MLDVRHAMRACKEGIDGHGDHADAVRVGDIKGNELLAEVVRAAGDDAGLGKGETGERTRPRCAA